MPVLVYTQINESHKEQTCCFFCVFFCISENNGADQQGSQRTADRCLCLRYNLSNLWFEISSLCACHVAVEPGFCQTWAEASKTGFIVMRFKQYGMLLI